jgi:hypothetical protein
MTAPSLAERLDGLLFLPVTASGPDGAPDPGTFRARVRAGADAREARPPLGGPAPAHVREPAGPVARGTALPGEC